MLSKAEKDGRLKPGTYTDEHVMGAGELHALQRDGMEDGARQDGAGGRVAVACDCGMEERASRVMERARIPKRYELCDFESYVTDLTDGKTWTAQHAQSLNKQSCSRKGLCARYPVHPKGLLFMGPSGVGKTHLAVAALKELIHRGHPGLFVITANC